MVRPTYPASSTAPIAARPDWVFAYGSLMWNPGFATPETRPARLPGWHRAFCIRSEHYRGTKEAPGLILGLLPGGVCRGMVHRLPQDGYDVVRHYLWDREIMNDGVYLETVRPVILADGSTVEALVYLANRDHLQYAGKLPQADAVRLIRQGVGVTGRNLDYLVNTVEQLEAHGFRDPSLHALLEAVRRTAVPLESDAPAADR
ncbi:gamma-glutamylcyclotransferase [Reyranella sp. CPCC 100927]|uniref:gamma-glutamylcyclotransferase n=1 Tax=Reyranella sp. CPCC 100927 TaxID=2599616 RepID=UPI0011B4EB77|nr:gamma-glutamylcyclotransferase [Reyranella sp. CPCC 100927]TWT03043.1 gamma-glutamylcyclotransferase [Reyranella sp. CPCC 100927]